MNKIFPLIITILISLAFALLIFNIIDGIEKTEKNECYKWQSWIKEQPEIYSEFAKWQKAQCEHYNINLK